MTRPSESDLRRAADLLRRGPWFGALPSALQDRILAAARIRSYPRGAVMALQGAATPGLGALLEGRAVLVRQSRPGEESLLYIAEPGFWFGEYSALSGATTMLGVIARTKVRMLWLPKSEQDRIVSDDPACFRPFAMLAIGRIPAYIRAFIYTNSADPEARLRGQLAVLCQVKTEELGARPPIDLPYSQADLASLIGVSRQTANQLVGTLARKGLIEPGFRSVRVPDPGALTAGL